MEATPTHELAHYLTRATAAINSSSGTDILSIPIQCDANKSDFLAIGSSNYGDTKGSQALSLRGEIDETHTLPLFSKEGGEAQDEGGRDESGDGSNNDWHPLQMVCETAHAVTKAAVVLPQTVIADAISSAEQLVSAELEPQSKKQDGVVYDPPSSQASDGKVTAVDEALSKGRMIEAMDEGEGGAPDGETEANVLRSSDSEWEQIQDEEGKCSDSQKADPTEQQTIASENEAGILRGRQVEEGSMHEHDISTELLTDN